MNFWSSLFDRSSKRSIAYPLLGLFSVMRGYNISIVVLAQYLASIFIFNPGQPLLATVLDFHLFLTVLASSLVIAAGYIINHFYDVEVDRINKPIKSRIDNLVSQKTKLIIYFILNTVGVLMGFFVSWRAAIFFSVYIFLIWLYSHKFKKRPISGLLFASLLAILPFFVIFVYHKNTSRVIFIHAIFLFCILLIRELVKDLENIKGAFVHNYQSIPVTYGEHRTKVLITAIALVALYPVYLLWGYPEIGLMQYYFYLVFVAFLCLVFLLWKAQSKRSYNWLHNLLKILLVLGVFSLALIDTSVLIARILNKL
ncbi:geranylgeranylglycerol-phosphate geranylgeranyltransferase [Flavicella sp.]|nr:geranylgeranylglycerol-phosphate geranylgeranyltransferase [Flavicella sp.]